MMPSSKSSKPRHFKIWSICFLIVAVSASVVFVAYVARQHLEEGVSANFINGQTLPRDLLNEIFGPDPKMTSIKLLSLQVSNHMSFSGTYRIEPQVLLSGKWVPVKNGCSGILWCETASLGGHSQRSV